MEEGKTSQKLKVEYIRKLALRLVEYIKTDDDILTVRVLSSKDITVQPWCVVVDCLNVDKIWKDDDLEAFQRDLEEMATIQRIIITNAPKEGKKITGLLLQIFKSKYMIPAPSEEYFDLSEIAMKFDVPLDALTAFKKSKSRFLIYSKKVGAYRLCDETSTALSWIHTFGSPRDYILLNRDDINPTSMFEKTLLVT